MKKISSFDTLFKTIGEALFEGLLISKDGRLIDFNDQFLMMTGYQRAELIGRTVKVRGEQPDSVNVRAYGSLGVIAALEFLECHFSKLGHRDLLVTHTIRSPLQPPASITRSVRRASGLVVCWACSAAWR